MSARRMLLDKEALRDMYESGLHQYQIAAKLGCSQQAIFRWMKAYGIPVRPSNQMPRRFIYGSAHHEWKHDKASYGSLHDRVKRLRGKPSLCEKCGSTTAKKYEWASISFCYADPDDYMRLCTSCHRKHDGHSRGPKHFNWNGGPPNSICEECLKAFARPLRNGKPRRFCSWDCYINSPHKK